MRWTLISSLICLAVAALAAGASVAGYGSPPSRTPDAKAVPMLGAAKITLLQGINQAAKQGSVIEAKIELDDSGALSLSTYTAKGFDKFSEVSGSPTASSWKPSSDAITAREDLVNSAVDLTLLDQGTVTLAAAVQRALAQQPGTAYWAVPTLQGKKPVVGVYIRSSDGKSHHLFVPIS
jgi:hypothetical protein